MDGVHDLGGRQGFGRIRYRAGAPAFHAAWEKRVNALYGMAVRRGIFNMDEYRHAIERMSPRHYLSASYYERSLTSLATLCVEKGVVTREELRSWPTHFPLPSRAPQGARTCQGRSASSAVIGAREERLLRRTCAHAGLHPRQARRRGQRSRYIRFRMRMRMACTPQTSRPTT
jgi:hypothetical protein